MYLSKLDCLRHSITPIFPNLLLQQYFTNTQSPPSNLPSDSPRIRNPSSKASGSPSPLFSATSSSDPQMHRHPHHSPYHNHRHPRNSRTSVPRYSAATSGLYNTGLPTFSSAGVGRLLPTDDRETVDARNAPPVKHDEFGVSGSRVAGLMGFR